MSNFLLPLGDKKVFKNNQKGYLHVCYSCMVLGGYKNLRLKHIRIFTLMITLYLRDSGVGVAVSSESGAQIMSPSILSMCWAMTLCCSMLQWFSSDKITGYLLQNYVSFKAFLELQLFLQEIFGDKSSVYITFCVKFLLLATLPCAYMDRTRLRNAVFMLLQR